MENKKVKNSLQISTKTLTQPLEKGQMYDLVSYIAERVYRNLWPWSKTALLSTSLVYGCFPACASPHVKK